jgi:hypothetical protein
LIGAVMAGGGTVGALLGAGVARLQVEIDVVDGTDERLVLDLSSSVRSTVVRSGIVPDIAATATFSGNAALWSLSAARRFPLHLP